MFYFELVRRFGNVVLMTSTQMSNQNPATYVQSAPEKVYEYIEDDLLYACDILPYATDDQYRESNDYRFSKGAALGLLTKVYATWAGYPVKDESKWEAAAKTARILVESGKHGLLKDYEQLWKNTCNGTWDPTESLIEISFYSPTVSGNSDPVGRIGKWNGVKTTAIAGVRGSCAANVKVVHTFVLDWREDVSDIRRDLSIANYQYTDTKKSLWVAGASDTDESAAEKDADPTKAQKNKQNYTPAKWDIQKYVTTNSFINNDKSNVNWYFLRYADVLLMYAEALNEWHHGPNNAALAALNMVRRRGYGLPYNEANTTVDLKSTSYEGFQEYIRNERAYELAFEGNRRQDLIRWGIYYETIVNTYIKLIGWYPEANYVAYQYTQKNKHELLPIPEPRMGRLIFF